MYVGESGAFSIEPRIAADVRPCQYQVVEFHEAVEAGARAITQGGPIMLRHSQFFALFLFVMVTAIVASAASSGNETMPHERKEVAGLSVLFGAEPEPALTEEMQFLRWRVTSLADQVPYEDLEDAEVTIERNGRKFGPFEVQRARRDPGLYQTQHIFTEAGEYESVLSFRKGEEGEVHTVEFTFAIRDRATLEIPSR